MAVPVGSGFLHILGTGDSLGSQCCRCCHPGERWSMVRSSAAAGASSLAVAGSTLPDPVVTRVVVDARCRPGIACLDDRRGSVGHGVRAGIRRGLVLHNPFVRAGIATRCGRLVVAV